MPNDDLRNKIANIIWEAKRNKPCSEDSQETADSILSLIAPELEKAQEVDKFIWSCSLNPFHGYKTCAGCFFRMSCSKIKSKPSPGRSRHDRD